MTDTCDARHPVFAVPCGLDRHGSDRPHWNTQMGIVWRGVWSGPPVDEQVRVGAVVLVTLAVGEMRWDGELCDVASMARVHGVLTAHCVSVCSPSEEAWVPVNERSVELVAPPVTGVAT